MFVDRMLKLADHLEKNVKEDEFYMMDFFQKKIVGFEADNSPVCKTVCCAAGHATNIPEFRELGLRMEVHKYNYPDDSDTFPGKVTHYGTIEVVNPLGMNVYPENHPWMRSSFWVMAMFLDVSLDTSYFVFDPSHYEDEYGVDQYEVKIWHVVDRIRKLILKYDANPNDPAYTLTDNPLKETAK